MKQELIPNITKYNIDSECNYENMFKTDKDQKYFTDYFKEKCENEQSCHINAAYEMDNEGRINEQFE